jgi:hypothetical protein
MERKRGNGEIQQRTVWLSLPFLARILLRPEGRLRKMKELTNYLTVKQAGFFPLSLPAVNRNTTDSKRSGQFLLGKTCVKAGAP